MRPPKLRIAHVVTPDDGTKFVEEWIAYSFDAGTFSDALEETHLIEWPLERRGHGLRMTRAQRRYRDIENEIFRRMLDPLKDAIAEAFVKAATEVLDRERERQSDARK